MLKNDQRGTLPYYGAHIRTKPIPGSRRTVSQGYLQERYTHLKILFQSYRLSIHQVLQFVSLTSLLNVTSGDILFPDSQFVSHCK